MLLTYTELYRTMFISSIGKYAKAEDRNMEKTYILNEKRAAQADRGIIKLIAIARCMDMFDEREWCTDMTNGFKYIIEDATHEITQAVFWEDTHETA